MKPKNDMIIFDRRKCLEYTQYKSDKAIYKGLAELVQSEIIARGPNEYNWFINPCFDVTEKHAGSYHMALYDAGISDFNIMTYSSVIPATASGNHG